MLSRVDIAIDSSGVIKDYKSYLEGTSGVKTTQYFQEIRNRPDRVIIKDEWIQRVVDFPEREHIQADGRIRRWACIDEMDGKYLRVILLPDSETVHNAFFDRGYKS